MNSSKINLTELNCDDVGSAAQDLPPKSTMLIATSPKSSSHDQTAVTRIHRLDRRCANREFLGNAHPLMFTIDRPEPFGLAMIESLACSTRVIVPEVLTTRSYRIRREGSRSTSWGGRKNRFQYRVSGVASSSRNVLPRR
jgi:hypothetical protein